MQESIHYFLDHATAKVSLTVTDGQFIVETQGKGALDKPRHIDILLSNLGHFCLVATVKAQNLSNFRNAGDYSYDSEFIFSYREGQKIKNKRVFVNSRDVSFAEVLNELERKRPDASLLHLPPEQALEQIGAASAKKTLGLFLILLIGIPVLIAFVFIILKIIRP
ncbi:hypothetical protein [Niabella aurantiaca]|uniref:hypothetical protein n=1 Tax=Niabella aurantiaca TaxID=379900 RepID=UPI00037BE023|nr:hypothetical protein [Niabella aurantiaca]